MSCYLGFVGNESALCRALSVLLGLAVHYLCCMGFVGNGSALCRAA